MTACNIVKLAEFALIAVHTSARRTSHDTVRECTTTAGTVLGFADSEGLLLVAYQPTRGSINDRQTRVRASPTKPAREPRGFTAQHQRAATCTL